MKRLLIGAALTIAGMAAGAEAGHLVDGNSLKAQESNLAEVVGGIGGVVLTDSLIFLYLSSPDDQEQRHNRDFHRDLSPL